MKFEKFEAKTLKKLENMENFEAKTMETFENMENFEAKTMEKCENMEKFENIKTHIQILESYGQSVEKTAAKLAEDYNKMSSEEREAFLESFTEQCQSTTEAGCSERVEYFAKAFKDPCQGDGCEIVENATKGNICKEQKLKFVQWTQVMCSKMHNLEPKKKIGGCVKNGIELLFCNHQQGPSTRVCQSASGQKQFGSLDSGFPKSAQHFVEADSERIHFDRNYAWSSGKPARSGGFPRMLLGVPEAHVG